MVEFIYSCMYVVCSKVSIYVSSSHKTVGTLSIYTYPILYNVLLLRSQNGRRRWQTKYQLPTTHYAPRRPPPSTNTHTKHVINRAPAAAEPKTARDDTEHDAMSDANHRLPCHALASTRHWHYQYCMVYGICREGWGEVIYGTQSRAIVLQ